MGFKSKLCFKYSTTHENRIWNKLVDVFGGEFDNRSENIYLVGNLIAEGKELDALIVKEDAIIVVDFKDYGGILSVSENQPWTVSGFNINSDRKNPFGQLSDNKYAVLNLLKNRLPVGYENWVNIGHINALVLFHQPVEYDVSRIQVDLSPSASRWFNICDFDHIIQTVDEITSRQTSLKGERIDILFKSLGVEDILTSKKVNQVDSVGFGQEFVPIKDISSLKNECVINEGSESFVDLYYSKAKSMDSIRLLIVGQDPYPTNSNGVAFCKDSYYELFQDDCSGGIVLKSMGIDKEMARLISRKNPKNLFYELLTSCGICFVNVFNKLYDRLSIEEIKLAAEEACQFNMPIVQKSKTIVLLGKGRTKNTFDEFYSGINYQHVLIHPSQKARAGNETEWSEAWESAKLASLIVD
jgi:hypothetical protein